MLTNALNKSRRQKYCNTLGANCAAVHPMNKEKQFSGNHSINLGKKEPFIFLTVEMKHGTYRIYTVYV